MCLRRKLQLRQQHKEQLGKRQANDTEKQDCGCQEPLAEGPAGMKSDEREVRCGWSVLVLAEIVSFMGVGGEEPVPQLIALSILSTVVNGRYKGTKTECCQDSDSLRDTIGILKSQTQPSSSCPGCAQWGQTTSGQGVCVSVDCVRLNPSVNLLSDTYFANICYLADAFFLFGRPGFQLW